METPADQRLLELLEKWLASLDLHLEYTALDEPHYWQAQAWVEHQRPSRWILELAKQKVLALRTQLTERIAAGDERFSDAIELTIFLANLVGSQHIERFIPLAEKPAERAQPQPPQTPSDSSTQTREMPKYLAAQAHTPAPAGDSRVARAERKPAPVAKSRAKPQPQPQPQPTTTNPAQDQVLADAERLIQWGRKWYELPELIARMADRPPLPEVRRILKENKSLIERKAHGE